MQAKAQPGFVDTAELAPTVQCTPSNYDVLPDDARPPYLTEVLSARPEQIRFDTVLAEEGGGSSRPATGTSSWRPARATKPRGPATAG